MSHASFEIVPHPRYRGEWLLKPTRGSPCGLWYRERQFAVSYAEWVAREVETAEIRVYNRDGSLVAACPVQLDDVHLPEAYRG